MGSDEFRYPTVTVDHFFEDIARDRLDPVSADRHVGCCEVNSFASLDLHSAVRL